jgi:hypothetical protein
VQYYNLNDSSKNVLSTNLGAISVEAEAVPVGQVIVSGTIIDSTGVIAFVANAIVSVTATPAIGVSLMASTNSQGKYSVAITLPLTQQYAFAITVSAQDFVTATSPVKSIVVAADSTVVLDLALARVMQTIEVDETLKSGTMPLAHANVTVVSSTPNMANSSFPMMQSRDELE